MRAVKEGVTGEKLVTHSCHMGWMVEVSRAIETWHILSINIR